MDRLGPKSTRWTKRDWNNKLDRSGQNRTNVDRKEPMWTKVDKKFKHLILYHFFLFLLWFLFALRLFLCFLSQNKWKETLLLNFFLISSQIPALMGTSAQPTKSNNLSKKKNFVSPLILFFLQAIANLYFSQKQSLNSLTKAKSKLVCQFQSFEIIFLIVYLQV